MKIYRIWQEANNQYDTYDSAVVVAENEEAARRMHPSGRYMALEYARDWAPMEYVGAEFIGEAASHFGPYVVCASFNAG